jgi:hypothetical protein
MFKREKIWMIKEFWTGGVAQVVELLLYECLLLQV